MMTNNRGIYAITNWVTGKSYFGSSNDCRRRWWEHRSRLRRNVHTNAKLQASWNKHTESSFVFNMILSVMAEDDLLDVEQEFLDRTCAVKTGYNLAPVAGRTTGWKASPETRKRMSDAAKLRDHSVQIAAMALATKGKKRPKELMARIAATKRANGSYVFSEEQKKRMSDSAKRRWARVAD